jgi:hypothetical protein
MMVVVIPMAGAGLFSMNLGANLGIMAPIMTFVLHLVFGAVLGAVYQTATSRLSPPEVNAGGEKFSALAQDFTPLNIGALKD